MDYVFNHLAFLHVLLDIVYPVTKVGMDSFTISSK